jgi:transcriptional regulator with XRE-family HTH domain
MATDEMTAFQDVSWSSPLPLILVSMLEAEQIGESIRKYREGAGISQTQLAAVLGIGQPTVARMEVGRVTPTFMTLRRLAHLLNIDLTIAISPQGGEVSLEDAPKRKPGRSARRRTG